MAEQRIDAWQQLAGKVAPAVFAAPGTWADPTQGVERRHEYAQAIRYLERHILGTPWQDFLALGVAVMAARRIDAGTVAGRIRTVHYRLRLLFLELGLTRLDQWDPARHLLAYAMRELLVADTQDMRMRLIADYLSLTHHIHHWWSGLSPTDQEPYRPLAALYIESASLQQRLRQLGGWREVHAQQRLRRKTETDAIVPHFAAIRAEAHLRHNRLARLLTAYRQAVLVVEAGAPLPYRFSYDEGGDPAKGIPPHTRIHCRLWNRVSFVTTHQDHYEIASFYKWCRPGRTAAAKAARNEGYPLFLEITQCEALLDSRSESDFWFLDLLRYRLLGRAPYAVGAEAKTARQAWLRQWGYGTSDTMARTAPLNTSARGLLTWRQTDTTFIQQASRRTEGWLVPVEGFYAASLFGLLAIDLFTSTGMRMNELQQIALTKECLVRTTIPAAPGAEDQRPHQHYLLRLIPKGQRENTRANYYISDETKHLLYKTAVLLREHYDADTLPIVPYHPGAGRAHRFGAAPYLFQYSGIHLPSTDITACMRFLLHGMVFRTADNDPVIVKGHLLRHAFATHAVQVQKLPLDVIGALLHQKDLTVTDYYSAPTERMVRTVAVDLLARIATHLDLGEAVLRAPAELQRALQEGMARNGTLAHVIGGSCSCDAFCPAQFACVGCSAKIPDPERRAEVEDHLDWNTQGRARAERRGLALQMLHHEQQIRYARAELAEMAAIEAYRKDEQHAVSITATP